MKKTFTLLFASLLTVALFAADRRPSVMLKSSRGFVVVIDGQRQTGYNDNQVTFLNLRDGRHTIEVYRISDYGYFRKSRKLISASSFYLRSNQMRINVDHYGRVQIREAKRNSRDNRGWNDNSRWDDDHNGRYENDRYENDRYENDRYEKDRYDNRSGEIDIERKDRNRF